MPLFFLHNVARFSPVSVADTPARQRANNLSLVPPNSANLPSGALLQGSSDDITTKIHEKRDYPGVLWSQLTPAGEASYVLPFFNSMFRNLLWVAGNCPFWVCLCHWSQQTGSFPKSTKLSHMWQQESDLMEGLLLVPCMVSDKNTQYGHLLEKKVSLFSPQGSARLIPHSAHTSSAAWLSGPFSFSFSLDWKNKFHQNWGCHLWGWQNLCSLPVPWLSSRFLPCCGTSLL